MSKSTTSTTSISITNPELFLVNVNHQEGGVVEMLNFCRSFLRSAQTVQAELFRSWTAAPVASVNAQVPLPVATVEVGVQNLRNQLRELQMIAVPPVISAAEELYEATKAAANAQFELHMRNPGGGRLSDLDGEGFTHHSEQVDSAIEEFSRAVGRQTAAAGGSDRDKMTRIWHAIPPDAPWMTFLLTRQPLHRVPATVSAGVDDAQEALRRDVIDFTDPGLARLHQDLVDALDHLADEFGGTFPPEDSNTLAYTEVPPEWKRTDPGRYYETLQALSHAREDVLGAYKKLMNAMSTQTPEPEPQPQPPAGQSFQVTTGDNSPITMNAPYAQASHGATANAGAVPAPGDASGGPWFRSNVFWTAVSAVAAVAAAVIAYFALTK
ncbi:hypothetical protein ACGFWD_34400 [Streptomyces sp. NPDC048448]|uniref:hypothetical protein n=1 Tax=unclassified Streptomyces TaxID=2593676 RepID=UPI00342E3EDB